MNGDQNEDNWNQFKGKLKEQWDKLTDDHFGIIKGHRDQLAGKIQELYGTTKEEAEKQVSEWEKKQKDVYHIKPYPTPNDEHFCVPVSLGSKPKQSPQRKLDNLLANTHVPSALATSTLHMVRRFLLEKSAANPLETAAFAVLGRLSQSFRDPLSCMVEAFDTLPPPQRSRLFVQSLILDPDEAIDAAMLSTAWAQELIHRVGVSVFDNALGPDEERPGRVRVYDPRDSGDDVFPPQVLICRVNDLRTANYRPPLNPGDFLPAELQQNCTPVLIDGEVQVVCDIRTTDCPGHFTSGVCTRVPEVVAGDGVVLQGVNFFSTAATVTLTARAPATGTRVVDARVWGDVETPVSEVVNGATVLINDCRVHDRLTFRVPEDLPPAIYEIHVVVPNITGIDFFGDTLGSNVEFIDVLPPPTARFQIASEELRARAETSPAWWGSDEVRLRVISVPLLSDLSTGTATVIKDIDLSDVDSGETRDITRLLFTQQQPILGVAMSILGHEIDGEEAYEDMITSSTDIFIDLVEEQAKWAATALAAVGGGSLLGKLGPTSWVLLGIAAGITAAVDIIVARWAPADLIIEDKIGLSMADLVALTSSNFPAPMESTYTTEGGIEVKCFPLDKIPQQYRERREYISDGEDSRYEVYYRFNRIV